MILVDIKNPEKDLGLHPLFPLAIEEMNRLLEENAPEGSYKIKGDDLIINIMSYETKVYENCVYESHKNYIDVQMTMEGEEEIGYVEREKLTVKTPYTTDIEVYFMEKPAEIVRISRGKACVIFPPDPHAPAMAVDGRPQMIKKMVAKIKF